MQTKREYLVSLGLAKAGRGRFSGEAKAALANAESEGVVFSDGKAASDSPESEPRAPRSVSTKDEGRAFQVYKPEPVSVHPVTTFQQTYNVHPRVREADSMIGEDENGIRVAFTHCRRCSSHIGFCRCNSVLPPKYLSRVVG
jgi:hypothetical protein